MKLDSLFARWCSYREAEAGVVFRIHPSLRRAQAAQPAVHRHLAQKRATRLVEIEWLRESIEEMRVLSEDWSLMESLMTLIGVGHWTCGAEVVVG